MEIKIESKLCNTCIKHFISAIPEHNVYQDSCKDNLEYEPNCKGYIKKLTGGGKRCLKM